MRSAKTQKRSRPSAILDYLKAAHEIAGKRITGASASGLFLVIGRSWPYCRWVEMK